MSKKTDKTKKLEKNPMMDHLLSALDDGKDIGHYGRLTFAIVGRHFMEPDDLASTLADDKDCSESEAKALVHQVMAADYSPPGPSKIRKWQSEQDFPLVPEGSDITDDANVYQDLTFPDEVYDKISAYHEEKAEAQGVG
jgi:hypothetical protein